MHKIQSYIREQHPSLLIDINQMPNDPITYLTNIGSILKEDPTMEKYAETIDALITNIESIDISCRGDIIVTLLFPFIKPMESDMHSLQFEID